jgi:hypothetical protein
LVGVVKFAEVFGDLGDKLIGVLLRVGEFQTRGWVALFAALSVTS